MRQQRLALVWRPLKWRAARPERRALSKRPPGPGLRARSSCRPWVRRPRPTAAPGRTSKPRPGGGNRSDLLLRPRRPTRKEAAPGAPMAISPLLRGLKKWRGRRPLGSRLSISPPPQAALRSPFHPRPAPGASQPPALPRPRVAGAGKGAQGRLRGRARQALSTAAARRAMQRASPSPPLSPSFLIPEATPARTRPRTAAPWCRTGA